MKIAHIINSLGKGGAEKLLSQLLPILNKSVDITLVVLTKIDNIYGEEIEKSGVKVEYLSNEENLKKIKVFKILRTYLKNNSFDIINVHLFPSQYFVPFSTKSKLVFTEHSTTSKRRSKVFLPIEKFVYSKYLRYIFVSKQAKLSFEEFMGEANYDKNIVIYNGVNISIENVVSENIREQFNLKENDKIISMISSFKAEKDHATLIRTMLNLPNAHLFLLGDGALMEEMMSLAEQLNLSKRVHFLGFKSNINDYIVQSDIIVQSSYREGFGLSVLESMSLGKPVLVSDIDGLSEIVDTEEYRFEPGNSINLTEKIMKLLFDVKEYNEATIYSLSRSKDFSIEKTALDYERLYKELL